MSAPSRIGLGLRLYLAAPAWSAVVGILVVVVTGLLLAAPRATADAAGVELRQAIADVRGAQRDVVSQSTAQLVPGAGEAPGLEPEEAAVYGALDEQLRAVVAAAPADLRERLGEVDYVGRSAPLQADAPDPSADARRGNARVAFDPRILDRVELVDGAAPVFDPDAPMVTDPVMGSLLFPVQVMMSARSAEDLDWGIGQRRTVGTTFANYEFELTGVFEADDPDAPVWQHIPSVLRAEVYDDGNTTPTATATVFVAPEAFAALPELAQGTRLTTWMSFDATGLTIDDAPEVAIDLRRFTNQREKIPALAGATLKFDSATLDAIERVLDRSQATSALLVLVGSGPLGVAGAVLGLAAQGAVTARRPALALAAARGASPGALRRALALEGALVGIPAAAIGATLALLLTPGPLDPTMLVVAAIVGLAPAAVFAARASFPLRRSVRNDLGASTRGRLRLALDLVVSGLAGLSTVLLLLGGGTTPEGRVDWLAVVAPLLLATAGALLGERLLPAPAGASLARAAAGPRLPGFLGLARAVRDPSGSIAGLALVVAIAIAVGSSVLLTTLDRGTATAAAAALGGDVRADGPPLTPDDVDALAELPGVAAVGGVEPIGSVTFSDGPERLQVPAYVVDGAAFAALQPDFPSGLDAGEEPIPFVGSPALVADIAGDENTIEGVDARLIGSAGSAAGIGDGMWLLVDRSASEIIGAGLYVPRSVVVGLAPGADSAAVADEFAAALPGARVTTLDDRIAQQRATPIPGTLRAGLAVAILIAALLAVTAILMSARLAAARRVTLSRSLHRLGADRRTIVTTFVVEALPALVASLVIGGALGAAIPFLVVTAVDLAPIVGGIEPPALAADPLALALIVVGALAAGALSLAPVLLTSRKESA